MSGNPATAITATEPVVFVSGLQSHGKGLTLMLRHILPLVVRRIGHK